MCFTPLPKQQPASIRPSPNWSVRDWAAREIDEVNPRLETKNPATTEFSKNLIRMVQNRFNSDRPILFKTDDTGRFAQGGRYELNYEKEGIFPVASSRVSSHGKNPLSTLVHESFHAIDKTSFNQRLPKWLNPSKKIPEVEKLNTLVEEFYEKFGKENVKLDEGEKSKRLSRTHKPEYHNPNLGYFLSRSEVLARQFTDDFIRKMTDEDINSLTKDPEMQKSLKRQKEVYIKESDENKYQRSPKIVDQLNRMAKQQHSMSQEEIRKRDTKVEKNWVRYMGGSCLLYTSPSPRDRQKSRMPSSA